MSLDYNDAVVKHAPWSVSKVQRAIDCPLRFKLEYIDRIKGTAAPQSAAGAIGKAVHSAIEWVLKKQQHSLKEALRRAVLAQNLTTTEMDSVFALSHNIQLFFERLEKFNEKNGVSKQHVETRFGLTRGMKPVPFFDKSGELFFRGVWDLCLITKDNYLIIIDHKTGEVSPMDRHEDQLRTYALAGIHVFPGIRGVQAAIHYVKDEDGLHWAKMMPAEYIRDEIYPWFINWINAAGENTSRTTPRKGWWCSFCQHTALCPLKR